MTHLTQALSASRLSWRYPHAAVPQLHELSFSLPPGALCMVLGANGAGKSTLLKLLAGRLPIQHGVIHRQEEASFVPQSTQPGMTISVEEMVLSGRVNQVRLLRAPGMKDRQICAAALARVGIQALSARDYRSLSGGEQQLVLMARAIASGARLLLLDEITAAMDWHNQATILQLLARLTQDGYTIVFTTHSPQHALDFASHCLLLHANGDWAFGQPETLIDDAALTRLYRLPVSCTPSRSTPGRRIAIPLFHSQHGEFTP